jgi:hypothetical protein
MRAGPGGWRHQSTARFDLFKTALTFASARLSDGRGGDAAGTKDERPARPLGRCNLQIFDFHVLLFCFFERS